VKNASSIARSLGAAAGSQVHADVMARKKASLLAHVLTSTRLRTSSGWRSASSCAVQLPPENPQT